MKIERNVKKRDYYKLLYVLFDFLAIFIINELSFFSLFGAHDFFANHSLYCSLYSLGTSIVFTLLYFVFGLNKTLTNEFSIHDAIYISLTLFITQVIGIGVICFVPVIASITRYAWSWLLATLSLFLLLPCVRLSVRFFDLFKGIRNRKNSIRTAIIGAGSMGKIAIDVLRRNLDQPHKIVLVVDDDKRKIGSFLSGVQIEGPISNVSKLIEENKIDEIVIAISNISKEKLSDIYDILEKTNVRIKRMPILTELDKINETKVMTVDTDELLCRDTVSFDNSNLVDILKGNCVLVTGAGGSIGSELTRQIIKCEPKTLIMFDIYENSTYDIQQELKKIIYDCKLNTNLITLIGSTYNEFRVEQIIKKYRPDFIYHAAAYKHVPLMEDSPAEAIRTNVIGTYNVAKMADKYKVKKMILVSTDKAVRPTNTMGATKRFAETVIQYFADKSKTTAYAAVRFGNVLGSNGSVVPLFKKQIESGGPVTITDKNIIRYFMTIPEAVSLILQCGLFATGGEIFILDMGKPVKIIDLAEKMIRQSGLVPYKDIQIVEVGLRPGEKLYEELLLNKETQTKTENKKIFIEKKGQIYPIEKEIMDISKAFNLEENEDVKKLLSSIITSYTITK